MEKRRKINARYWVLLVALACSAVFLIIGGCVWIKQTRSLAEMTYEGAHLATSMELYESRDDDLDGNPDRDENGDFLFRPKNLLNGWKQKVVLIGKPDRLDRKVLRLKVENRSEVDALLDLLIVADSISGGMKKVGSFQASYRITDESGEEWRIDYEKAYFIDFYTTGEDGIEEQKVGSEIPLKAGESVYVDFDIQLESLEAINAHLDSIGQFNMSEDEYRAYFATTRQTLVFSKLYIHLTDLSEEWGEENPEERSFAAYL